MLELMLIFFVCISIFVFNNLIYTIFALVFVLLLAAPGVYAMVSGAPYLPTTKKTIDQIIKMAELDADSKVVDLGCGDGRIIQKIAERGVKRAVGYEFSLPTYIAARIKKMISGGKEEIHYKNIWKQNYQGFDVLICFLMKSSMRRFENEIWPKLKKGDKVLSNAFKMPNIKPHKSEGGVHMYLKK